MNNSTALLASVLQSTEPVSIPHVQPAVFKAGTPEAKFVDGFAARIRDIYLRAVRAAKESGARARDYTDACFDTWMTYGELDQAVSDKKTAAIAKGMLLAAGFGDRLQPTTLSAQVEMQLLAIEAAKHARVLFGEQLTFELA